MASTSEDDDELAMPPKFKLDLWRPYSKNGTEPNEDTQDSEDSDLFSEDNTKSDKDERENENENDENNDEDNENDNEEPLPPPFLPHTFAPPFYGRPPTPLPPSPSLTSLLRPSRPTTPDASDDELPPPFPPSRRSSQTESSLFPSTAPRRLPASRVPTHEYYGFVLHLFSSAAFGLYLLWSYFPSPFLHALGIHYYPDRWWSLAVPSWLVVGLCYVYVALASYNLEILTPRLGSLETVVDGCGLVSRGRGGAGNVGSGRSRATVRRRARAATMHTQSAAVANGVGERVGWLELWNEGTDGVMDVPLAGLCEILYGEGRQRAAGGRNDAV